MARIFFFTSLSGFHLHARTTRNLASKQTPTIMEFPRAFNEEPLQPFERSAVRASEARILAAVRPAPPNGARRNDGVAAGCGPPAKKISPAAGSGAAPQATVWGGRTGKA